MKKGENRGKEKKMKGEEKKNTRTRKITIGIVLAVVIIAIIAVILAVVFYPEITESTTELERGDTLASISVDITTWDTENITIIEDKSMEYTIYVPVPKGYVASDVEGENTVKGGFVIYEGTDSVSEDADAQATRNQFVWVPVNAEDMYGTDASGNKWGKLYEYNAEGRTKLNWAETNNGVMRITSSTSYREPDIVISYDRDYYLTTYTQNYESRYELLIDLQIEFYEMIASVEKYGGFYIGRYETGDLSESVPVVQKGNIDIHTQTWYTMYERCKRIDNTTEGVTTSMIWGCMWDATLEFLVESGNKTYDQVGVDSSSWGNYFGETFEYTNSNGGTSTKDVYALIPTGSADYTKANNIYDLAGNVFEFAIEANSTSYRINRGGYYAYYGSNYPASGRRISATITAGDMVRLPCRTLYGVSGK